MRQKGRKVSSIVFKVDFEKVYDSVNWGFIFYMMESATISVLVNGIPSKEFKMKQMDFS